jgi:hypothetical protein
MSSDIKAGVKWNMLLPPERSHGYCGVLQKKETCLDIEIISY